MKKTIQLLVAIALAAECTVSAHAQSITIANFDFETGNLTGWGSVGQADAINWDPRPASSGNWVGFLSHHPTIDSDAYGFIAQNGLATIQSGYDYTLTIDAAASSWEPTGRISLELAGNGVNTLSTGQFDVVGGGGVNNASNWSSYSISISASTIAANPSWIGQSLGVGIGMVSLNGASVQIDNVTVTATEPGAIPIVNPSFETGDLSGWLSTGQAAAIDWNGPSPGGSKCAFLCSDPAVNDGAWGTMWQNVGALQANKDYTLTFYAAAANWQASAPLLATLSAWDDSANSGTTLVSQVYTVTATQGVSNWTKYSLSLPASVVEANLSSWVGKEMSINFGTNNGDPLVVDLVSLVASPSYAAWATENAGSQAANLDWDNDGVSNGVEFFMGAASGFTANPGLVGNTVTWPNGGNISSDAYGAKFAVQTSTDLTTWEDVLVQDLESNDGSLSYILNGSEKQFVRLRVTP